MLYFHEVMCLVEKLVHYLQCQDDSEGLYNQNITNFTISSKFLVRLQPNFMIVQHHKPECFVVNGITVF